MAEILESADLDEDQQAKLEREFAREYEPCRLREEQNPLGLIVRLADFSASAPLLRELLFRFAKLVIGVAKEDQTQHRDGIFR